MKKVVITGVSSGIGFASAKILCNAGYKVYGSVRNEEDANIVIKKLGKNYEPLIFDVTDTKCILSAANKVKENLDNEEHIVALINNAGIAMGGPVSLIKTDIFRKQFDINFFGLIDVTKAFLMMLGGSKTSKKPTNVKPLVKKYQKCQ